MSSVCLKLFSQVFIEMPRNLSLNIGSRASTTNKTSLNFIAWVMVAEKGENLGKYCANKEDKGYNTKLQSFLLSYALHIIDWFFFLY